MTVRLEGHAHQRFDGELNHLHIELLEMAGLVYEQVRATLDALQHQNCDDFHIVIERESLIDSLEKKVDSIITEVLAKRSPVATDLRVIIAFSKAVTDLERIGDEAARIAHISTTFYDSEHNNPGVHLLRDITVMGKIVCEDLKEATEALDLLDQGKAEHLLNTQDDLDAEFQSSLRRLTTFILEDARNVGHAINIVLILKSLVRIGSHARNLAEYIVYTVSGQDVRHPGSQEY